MAKHAAVAFNDVHRFMDSLFARDVHAKRVYSLANATLGVISSASMAVHLIGQGLAHARGLLTKHAVKQVDRLLSNPGVEVWAMFAQWVPYLVGGHARDIGLQDAVAVKHTLGQAGGARCIHEQRRVIGACLHRQEITGIAGD